MSSHTSDDAPPTDTQALAWVDADALPDAPEESHGAFRAVGDLLAQRPRRSLWRPALYVPILTVLMIIGAYVIAMAVWPLTAVAPQATQSDLPTLTGTEVELDWPEDGSAALSVSGYDTLSSPGAEPYAMASVTKVITATLILEELPLEVGEQGPDYEFTWDDESSYWNFLARGESALEVPTDGSSLTEYQMLQAILMASAGNYADRMMTEVWGSNDEFVDAATEWLEDHDLGGITITEPTGISTDNLADPAALARLGEIAMENPVFAEIVGTEETDLPGVGTIENTNQLLSDDDVVGIKTGTLFTGYNLLFAAEAPMGDETVLISAVVLNQPSDDERYEAARTLLDSAIETLPEMSTLESGTVLGSVTTMWGESAQIVTDGELTLSLWNGAEAEFAADIELGDARAKGAAVGSLAATGPATEVTTPLVLDQEIEDPSLWWRLTHPLDLLGFTE